MPRRKPQRIDARPGYVKYLRTSTEDAQAPERSQAAQRRDIQHRLVAAVTLPDLGEYIDNYTGTSADRASYQQMLSDARQGHFSHVFAAVPDRFGRDDVEALRAIDELTQLGISVRFATHPDLDPADEDDRLYLNILFGMAKREAAVIARRTRGGMVSKAMAGGWPWRAPDGYHNREVRLTELGAEEQLKHARYKRWVELDPDQAQVWRLAWDLLLSDRYSLEDICEKLHDAGHRLMSGRPFVEVRTAPNGRRTTRTPHIQVLSRAFHNWFYAGWVVVENTFVSIAPKTVRGEWEPIVTTEEFERGLAILASRNHKPMPTKRHFYLLQGLIYLDTDGALRKLTCGRPNARRPSGGSAYYCVPSSSLNFLCTTIDPQLTAHLLAQHIDPAFLPAIRSTYLRDVSRFTRDHDRERRILEARKRKLDDKELNLWRAFTDHGMRPAIYEQLAKDCQAERDKLDLMLASLSAERSEQIANLDAALSILSRFHEYFPKCTPEQQRAILLQMVERVVINRAGLVVRVEWKTPFSYLKRIADGGSEQKRSKQPRKAKTSEKIAGSLPVSLGAPIGSRRRNRVLALDSHSKHRMHCYGISTTLTKSHFNPLQHLNATNSSANAMLLVNLIQN